MGRDKRLGRMAIKDGDLRILRDGTVYQKDARGTWRKLGKAGAIQGAAAKKRAASDGIRPARSR